MKKKKIEKFFKKALQKVFINFKLQEVKLSVFEDANKVTERKKEKPLLDFILGRTRLAIKLDN